MSEWADQRIRDLLETSYAGEWGTTPSPGNARVLRATDIDSDGRINGKGALRQVPPAVLQVKRLQPGDIMLEASGGSPDKPVGRVAFFFGQEGGIPFLTSNFYKTLRSAKHVDARFLHWALLGLYRQPRILQFQQQTTGIINLKFQDYLDAKVHTPRALNEQKCIARILDTLDTQIQKTEALIAKLEKVKEGLLHDLLTRGIDDNGQLRPSPEQAPELYKESSLGLIPREWSVVSLLDAVELPSGQVSPLSEPYSNLPLVAPDHLESGTSKLLHVKTAREQGAISGKYAVRPGDVVYSKIRPYLRKAWLADMESICSADMYPLRPILLTPELLLRVILSNDFTAFANAVSMRTGIPKINRDELSAYEFALPPRAEQVQIEKAFVAMEYKVVKERTALTKLRAERVGVMEDLLTGRVRVTPLLDEAQATTPA
ncbi:restriction endonuclease subunit S [Alkalilimnicola ehrlichii]|uniref:restriction endonuclease subunit S n=1 Tax=Alkalilimnicola ehrlichii TaxID=351052 RepID=UPI003B9F223B